MIMDQDTSLTEESIPATPLQIVLSDGGHG